MIIAQRLGFQSKHFKHKMKEWSVSENREWGGTTVSAHAETTTIGCYLCGALEKLIRLLILVAILVRWSHKGMHILRINKNEWESSTAPQKPPWAKTSHSQRVAVEEHTRGKRQRDRWEGYLHIKPWHKPLCRLLKRRGSYWSLQRWDGLIF